MTQLDSPAPPSAPETPCASTLVDDEGRPMLLRSTTLHTTARDGLARVKLQQTYHNPHDEPLRLTYSLAMPGGASVTGVRFRVGKTDVVGPIEPRDRPFTREVGHVPARATIEVTVELDQRLTRPAEGTWEWRFPAIVSSRKPNAQAPLDDPKRPSVRVRRRGKEVRSDGPSFRFRLELHDALAEPGVVRSASHALAVESCGGHPVVGFPADSGMILERELIVQWSVARDTTSTTTRRDPTSPRRAASKRAFQLSPGPDPTGEPHPPAARSTPADLSRDVVSQDPTKRRGPKILGYIDLSRLPKSRTVVVNQTTPPAGGRASAWKRRDERWRQRGRAARSHARRCPRRGALRMREVSTQPRKRQEIRVDETIVISDLAHQMGIRASRVLRALWKAGCRGLTVAHAIDVERARQAAQEFGWSVVDVSTNEDRWIAAAVDDATAPVRPPVIALVGQVDHGKTTLLDALTASDVATHEVGGVTQALSGYRAEFSGSSFVFLDTPGHAAFATMRSRGMALADFIVLVVAADDDLGPTVAETIAFARAHNKPIVVWVNKCDAPGATIERSRQRLIAVGLVDEALGGDVSVYYGSARTRAGLAEFVEGLSLHAELLQARAAPDGPASGAIIDARVDASSGIVTSTLVLSGRLRIGDIVVADRVHARVRRLSANAKRLEHAGPGTVVELCGWSEMPSAGQRWAVVEDLRAAKALIQHRQAHVAKPPPLTRPARPQTTPALKLIAKAASVAAAEVLRDRLLGLSSARVRVEIVALDTGPITVKDIEWANATGAHLCGQGVLIRGAVRHEAERAGRRLIESPLLHQIETQVREAMRDQLPPERSERAVGRAEIRRIFRSARLGTVYGCRVLDGRLGRSVLVRLSRDGHIVHTGRVRSLRVLHDDVSEVEAGFECGLVLENHTSGLERDIVEAYEVEERRPML